MGDLVVAGSPGCCRVIWELSDNQNDQIDSIYTRIKKNESKVSKIYLRSFLFIFIQLKLNSR